MVLFASDIGPPTIEARCLHGIPHKTISPNATIRKRDYQCDATDKMHVINPFIIGYKVYIHNTCSCNEMLALCNRHLIDRTYIKYDHGYFLRNSKMITKNWKFEATRTTMMDVAMQYRGGKRRIYLSARKDILEGNVRESDAYVHMFVKHDKIPYDTEKMPRAIQYRSAKYNLQLATYLKPFEHEFYDLEGLGPSQTRVVTKGLNNKQIAELFIKKASEFDDPLFLGCDHSKFDSTVRVEHLRVEHSIYNRTYKSFTLRKLLSKQIKNKGFTRQGTCYSIKGTRMSGDYNTGLGNSLLNRIVLESWVSKIKHEILLDGDDSIVIIETKDYKKLDFNHFEKMGFETVVDMTNNILKVDYCQKRLLNGEVPIMMRNPIRALSHASVCLKNYSPCIYRRWINGVFECESACNGDVPIYRELRKLIKGKVFKDEDYYRKIEGAASGKANYTDVYETWGLTEQDQKDIESTLKFYLGYDCTDIVGYISSVFSKIFKFQLDDVEILKNASRSLTKHKASVIERFHSMDSSYPERWKPIGPKHVGYEHDAFIPTATAQRKLEKHHPKPKPKQKRSKKNKRRGKTGFGRFKYKR